jgi:hypothetical protein
MGGHGIYLLVKEKNCNETHPNWNSLTDLGTGVAGEFSSCLRKLMAKSGLCSGTPDPVL